MGEGIIGNEIPYLSAMKWMLIFLLPISTFAQTLKPGLYRDLKVEKPIVLDTGTLTLTPYCNENGRYVQVTGGTPPYFIRKTTQTNYTEMNPVNGQYLFAYAGPDNPLNQGLDGNYLVKDSGPGACGNLTPFKIWGNYGTQSHVEMHGVNFVQYDLTFNKATIADGATVYMYGTHQYNSDITSNAPGGTVGGASLIKTGTGDFTIGTDALITSACGQMWPGIKINNSDAYQRVIGDGAQIENAETAMEFLNQNAATKLTLSQCTLANNFNALRIHQGNLLNWSIDNSLIYTDESGLFPPYDDAHNSSLGSGKTFEGNYGIQFVKGNGTATNSLSLTTTTIRNYMVGIDGYGAWFSADNCIFDKIRLAGINCYVSGSSSQPIAIHHCTFNLNAADAFTTQRTALRNDINFQVNVNLEPMGTFGIVALNVPFAITGGSTLEGKANTFDSAKPRVGYYSNLAETLEGITFRNLDFGYFNEGVTGSLSIQGNTFENNTHSIYLNGGLIALELRCNQFITDDALARVGLRIGSGVTIENDGIGGNGTDPNPNPNANIWPRKPNTTSAESPDNWVSIQKPDAGGELFYHRYTNEFIGYYEPNSGLNQIQVPASLTAKSPKAVREWCETTFSGNQTQITACIADPMNMAGWNSDWVAVCDNLDDQTEYFPARQAVANGTTASLTQSTKNQIYLGDPIPNPSRETATIELNWPKEKGTLVVFELGTGKAVWQANLVSGRQNITVPVKAFSVGVYGYRLEGDCPCPEPKRLIVIH